ncbi:MAG: D-tyrosyl-tRNA(Tyr) deacylase [Clostridia bacterium]|nr:D-tyrosyl-tRNA(Tyr) deacylase [Clostridia bacterium]
MKAVLQVVDSAKLSVDGQAVSQIEKGLVVFFCVEKDDEEGKIDFFAKKIANLRIFPDENGKTNLSVLDVKGQVLFVSQFTLAADCEHGNRPSFTEAELPERAQDIYLKCAKAIQNYGVEVKLGVFGADMKIDQVNAGPFTIILSK